MSSRNFSMVEYFKRRAKSVVPRYRFAGNTKEDFSRWQQELLAELKSALGPSPDKVDLNPQIEWEKQEDGLLKRSVVLDTEADYSVVALVYIPAEAPKDGSTPAILCSHGHGDYGKDSVMGVRKNDEPQREAEIKGFNFDYGLQMAKKGYVTIAIDYRSWGERDEKRKDLYGDRDPCNVHFIRGSIMGINLLTLNIWDARRTLDYLCGLEQVDAERIGAMGLSFGGTMTTWMSLLDQRIKATDIICYSDRFTDFAIGRGNFCGSQIVPGLLSLCDVPDLHGLIAPRPLLVEVGKKDECFLMDSALSCYRELEKIYTAAGATDRLELDLFEGGHQFAGGKAFRFFDKYLKNI